MFTIVIFSFAPKTMEERKKKTFSHIVVFIQRQFIATMQCNAAIQAVRMFNHIQNTTQQNARDVFFFLSFSLFLFWLFTSLSSIATCGDSAGRHIGCASMEDFVSRFLFLHAHLMSVEFCIYELCVWACNRNMPCTRTAQCKHSVSLIQKCYSFWNVPALWSRRIVVNISWSDAMWPHVQHHSCPQADTS